MANESVKQGHAPNSDREPDAQNHTATGDSANAKVDAAVAEYRVARVSPVSPLVKVVDDGGTRRLEAAHPNPLVGRMLLKDATGASDLMFLDGIMDQLARSATEGGQINEGHLNFMLSVVRSTKPRDQLEAMLAAQMAVVHAATMRVASKPANTHDELQLDSLTRALNNLARTFAAQMEALKRYRTGGEQTVTVQHVSVGDGGQAFVGNVTQREPRKASETPSNSPHPPQSLASQTPATAPIDFNRRSRSVRRRTT
jgi:hypothetical protein